MTKIDSHSFHSYKYKWCYSDPAGTSPHLPQDHVDLHALDHWTLHVEPLLDEQGSDGRCTSYPSLVGPCLHAQVTGHLQDLLLHRLPEKNSSDFEDKEL